jgi:hypothetical protein
VGSPVQWHEPVTIAAQNEGGDGAWPENTAENRVDDGAWPEQWARGRRGRGKRQRNLDGQARRQRSRSVGSEAQREGVRREKETDQALGLCTSDFPSVRDLALGKKNYF